MGRKSATRVTTTANDTSQMSVYQVQSSPISCLGNVLGCQSTVPHADLTPRTRLSASTHAGSRYYAAYVNGRELQGRQDRASGLIWPSAFLTTHIIDRYLSKAQTTRNKLQLVGVTAMLIASKYEEIYAPEVRDFVHICAHRFPFLYTDCQGVPGVR